MMYKDCAKDCKAHEHPTQMGHHLAACGVADGAAKLMSHKHGPFVHGVIDHANATRPAIRFEDGGIYAWVGGSWVHVATPHFRAAA